jgi:hypothetical protein
MGCGASSHHLIVNDPFAQVLDDHTGIATLGLTGGGGPFPTVALSILNVSCTARYVLC